MVDWHFSTSLPRPWAERCSLAFYNFIHSSNEIWPDQIFKEICASDKNPPFKEWSIPQIRILKIDSCHLKKTFLRKYWLPLFNMYCSNEKNTKLLDQILKVKLSFQIKNCKNTLWNEKSPAQLLNACDRPPRFPENNFFHPRSGWFIKLKIFDPRSCWFIKEDKFFCFDPRSWFLAYGQQFARLKAFLTDWPLHIPQPALYT